MSFIFGATQPDSGIPGGVNAFKAYNRQVLELIILAQTLPDGGGLIAEPYPPIIELRRFLQLAQPLLPDKFLRHKEVRPSAVPFSEEFVFEINLEDIQIKYFDNDSAIYNVGAASLGAGVGDVFQYDFRVWDSVDVVTRPNPDNLLMPRTDTGYLPLNDIVSINAQFKKTFDITLANYVSLAARQSLSTKPLRTVVCPSDSEFLNFHIANLGGNAFQIDTFDKFGTPIDRGIVNILNAVNPLPIVTRFGVGPVNINNIPPAWWFPVGGAPPFPPTGTPSIDSNVHYYEVTFGFYDPANFGLLTVGPFAPSVTYRYYYKKKCCKTRYRVHFINQFGTDDVVTFSDNEVIQYNTKDEFFERNLPLVMSPKNRSRIQLIKEAEDVVTLTKNNLTREQVNWLKELQLSPNVFVERPQGLVSYFVESGNNNLIDTDATNNEIEITLVSSTKEYSQRN